MATNRWPPPITASIIAALDFDNYSKFVGGLIPFMDARQYIYNFLKEIVQWLPHQPPEYRRIVYGSHESLFGGGRIFLPMGKVGYNAQQRQVIWEVNPNTGGPQKQEMYFDVQSVVPVVFQLLMMIPWDFMGEAEAAFQDKVLGADQCPSPQGIVGWLYGKLRTGLADIGITIPAIPGAYSRGNTSIQDVAIPPGTYPVTHGLWIYAATLTNALIIPTSKNTANNAGAGQKVRNVTATVVGEDPGLVGDRASILGNEVTMTLPGGLLPENWSLVDIGVVGRENLEYHITDFRQGRNSNDTTTAATRVVAFTNTDPVNMVTILAGSYRLVEGKTYPIDILANIDLAPDEISAAFTLTATEVGSDPTWKNSGNMDMTSIAPVQFPSAITGEYLASGVQGIDADPGAPAVLEITITNTASPYMTLLPSRRDILLYNIPIMQFSQIFYEAAMSLVNEIPHHPPVFERIVYAGGVYTEFFYELFDYEGNSVGGRQSVLPAPEQMNGRTLVVSAIFKNSEGRVLQDGDDNKPRELLRYHFAAVSFTIDFEAQSGGTDPFFAGLPNVALDDTIITAQITELTSARDVIIGTIPEDGIEPANIAAAREAARVAEEVRVEAQNILINRQRGAAAEFERLVSENTPPDKPRDQFIADFAGVADAQTDLNTKTAERDAANKQLSYLNTVRAKYDERIQALQTALANKNEPPPPEAGQTSVAENNFVKALRSKRISTPVEGVNIPNRQTNLIALEQGFNAVIIKDPTDADVEILPATSPKFRLEISSVPGGDLEKLEDATQPDQSYMNFRPRNRVSEQRIRNLTGIKAWSLHPGQIDVRPSATIIPIIQLDGKLAVQIKGVSTGERPAEAFSGAANEADPGGNSLGTFTELIVDVLNNTDGRLVVMPKDLNFSWLSFDTAPGTTFLMPINQFPAPFTLEAPSMFLYNGTISSSEPNVTNHSVSSVQVSFSAPLGQSKWFANWQTADQLAYIGDEFNLGNPFGADGMNGARRYVQARLMYKLWERNKWDKTPLESKNWYVQFTENPDRVPRGINPIMQIDYDATKRQVTIRNLKNGELVTMHLNSVPWFMVALLMLIPVEVF